jgi:hypothetical protein
MGALATLVGLGMLLSFLAVDVIPSSSSGRKEVVEAAAAVPSPTARPAPPAPASLLPKATESEPSWRLGGLQRAARGRLVSTFRQWAPGRVSQLLDLLVVHEPGGQRHAQRAHGFWAHGPTPVGTPPDDPAVGGGGGARNTAAGDSAASLNGPRNGPEALAAQVAEARRFNRAEGMAAIKSYR